jgi:hypothetical protein
LLLPGQVGLHVEAPNESGDQAFWLVSSDGTTAHLKGVWNQGRS